MECITSGYDLVSEKACVSLGNIYVSQAAIVYNHATGANQYRDTAEKVGSKDVKSSELNPI